MQAVFLDRNTFSPSIDLPTPDGVTSYQVFASTPQDDAVIIERCIAADIIITNKVKLSAGVIKNLPKLKLIQLAATGVNNVDVAACDKHGVALLNVAGYAVKSVPEHTFMLMLNAMRAGLSYHQKVMDGSWQQDGKFCLLNPPIFDLQDKTLGIIGVGSIGKRVSEIAKAFGMRVLWAERQHCTPRNSDYSAFDEVLEVADVISLHCPLTKATKHLINQQTIGKMQQKPLIVNVARGDVVDSHAIVQAVNNEQILGYAADVFSQEPPSDNEPLLCLADHPRVVFSPHNAWGSMAAQQALWQQLSQQVSQFIAKY